MSNSLVSHAPHPDQIARVLAHLQPQRVERVATGVSTWVYRVRLADSVMYLRVLPEAGMRFAPAALAHALLEAAGVRVPAVLDWAEATTTLGYATMLTAELPGHPLAALPPTIDRASMLWAAGHDLAQLSRLCVEGFGWIDRSPDAAPSLRAAYPSLRTWLDADLDVPLAMLEAQRVLTAREVVVIRTAITELSQRWVGAPAYLVHGDLDPTHIFVEQGSYAGLIDFGEIRGAHALYDLGHFAVEHRDLLPPLLDGYAAVGGLPADAARQIDLTALLIATRRLGTRLARHGTLYDPDLTALRRGLATL